MGNMVEVDKLIWVDDMHGQYSVKSGYNKMINISRRGNDPRVKDKLNCLGKIHAPPKVKHLLWRICKGCLPTQTLLQERCVLFPLVCPLCEHYNEDDISYLIVMIVSKSKMMLVLIK
jgi:hypothetical protein